MAAAIKCGARVAILCAMSLAALASQADAARFEARRGLNMDIWVTWPDEARWRDPEVLFPFPEWRHSVDAAKLATLREAGFDFLRMPVDPSPFLSEASAAHHDRLYEEVMDSARAVNAAGLKVIVDLHLFAAGANRSIGLQHVMDDPALFDRYLEIVRRLGRMVGREDPVMMAFELMNEPSGGCEADDGDWPEKLQRLYAAARASALDTTLVLTGACGGSAQGLAAIDPSRFADDNVLWSFHSYAPFLLTHQGATWAGDFIPHVTGLPYPPHSVPRAELEMAAEKVRETIRSNAPWTRRAGLLSYFDEQLALVDTEAELAAEMAGPFETVNGWAMRHGVPPENIILGEFGMIRQEWQGEFVMKPEWRAAYIHDMARHAEARRYGWAAWGYGGAFGIVEAFGGEPAEPDVLETIRALPSD